MTIYLTGGCPWGLQKYFNQFPDVHATEMGHVNSPGGAPTYRGVCDNSGHAETVKVRYGPGEISLRELFDKRFLVIGPLSMNKQGNDGGIQYCTGIYCADQSQLLEIQTVHDEQEAECGMKLMVEPAPIQSFYSTEEYRQKYLDKNPDGYCHIPQKAFHLAEGGSGETLRKRIDDLSCEATQNTATERFLTGEYDDFSGKGIYIDIVSDEPLFSSLDKFDSDCGWSAFSKLIEGEKLKETTDRSYGMVHVEVRSVWANLHLGHVLPDGPREMDGLRYCINSALLRFIPYDKLGEEGYREYKKSFER